MNAVTDTCPPLEDIAAFLDGRLSEEERARVVAHLADCESCYAVFASAARFQLEEEGGEEVEPEEPAPTATATTPEAPVVPFSRQAVQRWALPLAAVLVLGLATIPLYLRYNRMPEMVSAELVDPSALKNVPTGDWTDIKRGLRRRRRSTPARSSSSSAPTWSTSAVAADRYALSASGRRPSRNRASPKAQELRPQREG